MTAGTSAPAGRVVIVGGGPGDVDLITVRGLDRLLAADVVVVDRLAPRGLLDRLRPGVEVIDAGRTPSGRMLAQHDLNALMVGHARAGRTVVRLKGGDPYVLAHGAEEADACTAAGVEIEVVPGLSSATAAPALAGVSLTSRDGAQGFTVVSGHLAPDDPAGRVDWSGLARGRATIVILMAMANLPAIATRLIDGGLDPAAPAHCVAEASLPTQRSVHAPLAEIAGRVAEEGLANPAVVIIEPPAPGVRRILVIGGARSGKSRHAETLAAASGGAVAYVATSVADPGDAEWQARVDAHRARRPAGWTTTETADPAPLLRADGAPVLIDSVTAWLAGAMDAARVWDAPAEPNAALTEAVDEFVTAWRGTARHAVAVTDEIGLGVVPETVSGRLFRDELGILNQRLAAESDEVWQVTAGIARRLR